MRWFLNSLLCLVVMLLIAGSVLAFGHHNQPVFRQHTVIRGGAGVAVVPGNAFVNRSYYVQQAPVLVQQSPVVVQRSFAYAQQAPVIVQQAPIQVQQAPVYTQQVQRSFVQQQYAPVQQQVQLAPAQVQYQQVAADVQQCQTCSTQAASFAPALAPSYATGGCTTGVGASFAPGYGTVPTYPTVGAGIVPSGHGVFRQRTVQRY